MIDLKRSAAIASEFTFSQPPFLQCLSRACLHSDLRYVEGFVVPSLSTVIVMHAWLLDQAGDIVDPLLYMTVTDKGSPVYFPSAVYDAQSVLGRIKPGVFLPMCEIGALHEAAKMAHDFVLGVNFEGEL